MNSGLILLAKNISANPAAMISLIVSNPIASVLAVGAVIALGEVIGKE